MAPLPILFRDDLSIDHAGMAAFVEWQIENGTTNFCLTFTYSQLDFISREEIVDITRNVMEVVKDENGKDVYHPQKVVGDCKSGVPLYPSRKSKGLTPLDWEILRQ